MNIFKTILKVGSFTMISRISGYARDMFLSANLGVGLTSDIFLIILRLPNLFRTLFGEGALSVSFIPLYSSTLESKGFKQAQNFAAITQSILSIALLIFCAVLYFFMPQFIDVTVLGFHDKPDVMVEITRLSRITISYLAFISLVTFYGGVLNSHGKYGPFALVQVIMNVGLIIAVLLDGIVDMPLLDILAYAIAICGALELLWMWAIAKIYGFSPGFAMPKLTGEIKDFFKRLLPGIVGSGVWQINSWIEIMIISAVPGGMTLIYYADRVNQLPLAIIGTAMGTTLMPVLAKKYEAKDISAVQSYKCSAIEFAMFMAIPASMILYLLSGPIISFLFEGGKFTADSVLKSGAALSIYAFALPAQITSKVFISSFYASGDTKTPVKISAFCILLNAIVAMFLIDRLQHLGMACASVCSAWSNILISYLVLKKRGAFSISANLIVKLVKILIASSIMIVTVKFSWGLYSVLIWDLMFSLSLGGAVYIALSFILNVMPRRGAY
jgi:putative peptidoglycan lipid II flippase